MKFKEFSRKAVAKFAKVTPRTIQYYTDLKLVIPGIDNPIGRGKNKLYSIENVFEIMLIKRLSLCRLGMIRIKHIMDKFPTIQIPYDNFVECIINSPAVLMVIINPYSNNNPHYYFTTGDYYHLRTDTLILHLSLNGEFIRHDK